MINIKFKQAIHEAIMNYIVFLQRKKERLNQHRENDINILQSYINSASSTKELHQSITDYLPQIKTPWWSFRSRLRKFLESVLKNKDYDLKKLILEDMDALKVIIERLSQKSTSSTTSEVSTIFSDDKKEIELLKAKLKNMARENQVLLDCNSILRSSSYDAFEKLSKYELKESREKASKSASRSI